MQFAYQSKISYILPLKVHLNMVVFLMEDRVLVLKFGGASVASPDCFARIADIIIDRQKTYSKVVVVVSAMGDTTDDLLSLAKQVHPHPPKRELDMLVSVGERISIALLAMALSLKGMDAISLTGSQSGIITTADHSEARIVDVKPFRILKHLEEGKIVIVAGFQGMSSLKEITTLGRGGSDTSAVALGVSLGALKVEFFKDVKGVYSEDPKKNPDSKFFSFLTYEEALSIMRAGAEILHVRALELASKNSLPLYVLSFNDPNSGGTLISSFSVLEGNPIYE